MPTTSSMIIDAAGDPHLRARIEALGAQTGHNPQTLWAAMPRIVAADVGGTDTIASILRYGLGQAGKDAGRHEAYVSDAQITTAINVALAAAG